jgi:hypothetical protein
MSRYFFHIKDGKEIRDEDGAELPDLQAVRDCAIKTAGDMLSDGGGADLWSGHEWQMIVTDEAGREVLVLRFSAEQKLAA